jgi:hypothetical protein
MTVDHLRYIFVNAKRVFSFWILNLFFIFQSSFLSGDSPQNSPHLCNCRKRAEKSWNSPLLRDDVSRAGVGSPQHFNPLLFRSGAFRSLSVVIARTIHYLGAETLFAFVPAVSTGIVVPYTTVYIPEKRPVILSVFLFSLCFHILFFSSIETPLFGGKNRSESIRIKQAVCFTSGWNTALKRVLCNYSLDENLQRS